ncbi:ATP-binding protein [Pseudorhodoferax sp.]|uniref:ATP-binding protein n=1 Tax=Pseudorhodoferax sp. TaxID=1993553 RepID=UPI002DD6365C|nr:ATP-binding protein [Pseudorhodoferax sp.]
MNAPSAPPPSAGSARHAPLALAALAFGAGAWLLGDTLLALRHGRGDVFGTVRGGVGLLVLLATAALLWWHLRGRAHDTPTLLLRLLHSSPDAICVAGLDDGAILLANASFLRMAGLAEDQVLGRSALELGLWRDPQLPLRLRDLLHNHGRVHDLRTLVHLRGSGPRAMLLTAAPFVWHDRPVAVITTRDASDTERARAEADAILDHANVGLALVRDRRFERVNPPFELMFGHPVGSLTGQTTATLFSDPNRYAEFWAYSDDALRRGGLVDIERDARRADGSTFRVHLSARPIDPDHPLEGGAIWVAEDVTERTRSEQELALAKQQAEAASQAKSAFLATMSHEIRTPLNGVLGLARLMEDPDLNEHSRREYLEHLIEAAELLNGIVSDVLDLSKIEAGHLEIETIVFDLHALAHSTFATFAPLGRERGLAMTSRVAANVAQRVRGDPVRVRQILANFLNNALKFTRRGSVTLCVRAGQGGLVRFEVHDTGPGVAEAVRERIFQPFAQADSSTTRRFGGTGLGLSICRELANRMGGEVGVDSDGHSASCFWAELRLPSERRGPGSTTASVAPLTGLHVLVAEDNPVNMLIVSAMLRRLGAQVLEASDGAQAVTLVEAGGEELHAALMDLHMPELDGLAATRRLRAGSVGTTLPIYALSAAVLEQDRLDALAAGMNGFIAKPVNETELLRALLPWVPVAV